MSNITPQLRICVTSQCNLKCIYCRPEGEGFFNLNEKMTSNEILKIVKLCSEIGFTHIKFTGGEPLLRNDIIEIVSKTKSLNRYFEILLVTNGMLLAEKALQLKNAGIDEITLSLDAAQSDLYYKIRGGDYSKILLCLKICKDIGLKVRINSVIMNSNHNQIKPLLDLAYQMNTSIKFLDLINLQTTEEHKYFWAKEYFHFNNLIKTIENYGGVFVGFENAPGGIGGPLLEYKMINGLQVVIKDASIGTFYAQPCLQCNYYPCQDALISLRITHDGNLKRCLIRNDNITNILFPLRKGDDSLVSEYIKHEFNILCNAKYIAKKWNPNL